MFHRLIICIIFSGILSSCASQKSSSTDHQEIVPYSLELSKHYFTVLIADKVSFVNGSGIRSGDHLGSMDSVIIRGDGYLMLAHFSGKLIEFEGPGTISIGQESSLIQKMLAIEELPSHGWASPDLLFSRKKQYDDQFYKELGPVEGNLGLAYSYPFNPQTSKIVISKNYPKACLRWTSSKSRVGTGPYRVDISDIANNQIDMISTNDSLLSIDFSNYQNESDLYLVRTSIANNLEYSTGEEAIYLGEEHRYVPRACIPNAALAALELALYYEEIQLYLLAWEYYEKAAALTDHPFYQQMFLNFKERKDDYFGYKP